MTDLFENPMGLDGFEFVEFTAPEKGIIEPIFEAMGFTKVAIHNSKDVTNIFNKYNPCKHKSHWNSDDEFEMRCK